MNEPFAVIASIFFNTQGHCNAYRTRQIITPFDAKVPYLGMQWHPCQGKAEGYLWVRLDRLLNHSDEIFTAIASIRNITTMLTDTLTLLPHQPYRAEHLSKS
jgi:hypothetical protein